MAIWEAPANVEDALRLAGISIVGFSGVVAHALDSDTQVGVSTVPAGKYVAIDFKALVPISFVDSNVVEDAVSTFFPKSPYLSASTQPACEYELPQVGQPHPAFRESEAEQKNRLSDQRTMEAMNRLLTDTKICKDQQLCSSSCSGHTL